MRAGLILFTSLRSAIYAGAFLPLLVLAQATPNQAISMPCHSNSTIETTTATRSTQEPLSPESSSGFRLSMTASSAFSAAVVTANPYASEAGCLILRQGGTAIDAAIAVQFTLGLVEPQSSGLGGGGFLLYYDAKTGNITAYDGRETAPQAVSDNYLRWVHSSESSGAPLPDLRRSGRAIGTPGILRMLELAHSQHGTLPWQTLPAYSTELAQKGFALSPRLHHLIQEHTQALASDSQARSIFLDHQGKPYPIGTMILNLPYAHTVKEIATQGAEAFYSGSIAQDILQSIHNNRLADGSPMTPGSTTLQDLANYQPIQRTAICTIYRKRFEVCGMPPPSAGGIGIAQALGIIEQLESPLPPPERLTPEGGIVASKSLHLLTEILNQVFADRNRYIGDWDPGMNAGIALPSIEQLLDTNYLRSRAQSIQVESTAAVAQPGQFSRAAVALADDFTEESGTTHISIVDQYGNAVSFTSTVESAFGSFHMTRGFFLNNQLTDFSTTPTDNNGSLVVNRIEPLKRPRSSMSPTLVFSLSPTGTRQSLLLVTGSPGGSAIIAYTLKSLVATLDWELTAQQAAGLMNFHTTNQALSGQSIPTLTLEADYPLFDGKKGVEQSIQQLVQDHARPEETIQQRPLTSGLSILFRQTATDRTTYWQGGADPRREGVVLGY